MKMKKTVISGLILSVILCGLCLVTVPAYAEVENLLPYAYITTNIEREPPDESVDVYSLRNLSDGQKLWTAWNGLPGGDITQKYLQMELPQEAEISSIAISVDNKLGKDMGITEL